MDNPILFVLGLMAIVIVVVLLLKDKLHLEQKDEKTESEEEIAKKETEAILIKTEIKEEDCNKTEDE